MRKDSPRHHLMCRPNHFDVSYSINLWMNPGRPASADVGLAQWKRPHDLIADLGHRVELTEPLKAGGGVKCRTPELRGAP